MTTIVIETRPLGSWLVALKFRSGHKRPLGGDPMLEFPCLDTETPQLGSECSGRHSKDSGSLGLIALSPLQCLSNQAGFTLPELCLKETWLKDFHAFLL
jgi:hypothetical protein